MAEAGAYLRSATLAIEARKQWMGAVPGLPFTIPAGLRLEEGRSLRVYGDGGWGSVVRSCRQRGRAFPDELVDAAIRRVRAWAPEPAHLGDLRALDTSSQPARGARHQLPGRGRLNPRF